MSRASGRRRNTQRRQAALAPIVEVAELRTLMSAVSGSPLSMAAETTLPATKQVTVEAEYYANTGGYGLKIDEIRLVGDEIRVFSSITKPAPDSIVTMAFEWRRDSRTITVPNRELTVTYHYAFVDSPKTDLHDLRQAGTSSLLYRNPLADTASAWPIADPATKEITIEARAWTGFAYSLRIDEIRLVGDEIVVFSTLTPPPPGIYPAIAITLSETRTLTVPNRELSVSYRYANLDTLQTELYHLRQSGTSSLLYRSPLADPMKPWTIVDVDAGPGSDVGLDFTLKPSAPEGLQARVGEEVPAQTGLFATGPRRKVTLYFDEQQTVSNVTGQRFVNEYEVNLRPVEGFTIAPDTGNGLPRVALMDTTAITLNGPDGTTWTYRGALETIVGMGSQAFQVRVRRIPVFPDGATGTNALASPWSDWSDIHSYAVLPNNEQIMVNPVEVQANTGLTTIDWTLVENAASHEIWIEKAGRPVLRKSGITGTLFRPATFLGSGDFKVWVKAIRTDGTTTGWSKPVTYKVPVPTLQFNGLHHLNNHDKTPTIRWYGSPLATQYQISFIDLEKEDAASTMRFASNQDRLNFITAYSRTLPGTSTEHTVDTPLAVGRYRVELQMQLGPDESVSTSSFKTLDTVNSEVVFLMPNSTDTVQWHPDTNTNNYEIWVAYLGPEPGQTIVFRQPGKWAFDRVNNVSSTYRFSSDAPGGKYRIWLRPVVFQSTGEGITSSPNGPWSAPSDIVLQDPLLRQSSAIHSGSNSTSSNGKLTWDPIPGAQGYEVVLQLHNPVLDQAEPVPTNPTNLRFQSSQTEFQLPNDLIGSSYSAWIRPLNSRLGSSTSYSHLATVAYHWQFDFAKVENAIQWDAVPDAHRYEVQIKRAGVNGSESLVQTTVNVPSFQLPPDLQPGRYMIRVTAVRPSDGDKLPLRADFNFDVEFPKITDLHVDGTVVAWNAVNGAQRYLVSVETIGGDMFRQYQPGDAIADYFESNHISQFVFITGSISFDLAKRVLATYRNASSLRFRVTVEAVYNRFTDIGNESAASIEFSPAGIPAYSVFAPTIERTARPKPAAPELNRSGEDFTFGSNVVSSNDFGFDGSQGGIIYRAENGTLLDVEHVRRFQLRVTDLQTGRVRFFDESQILALMQFSDRLERPFGYLVLRGIAPPPTPNSQNAPFRIPGLLTGAYRIEARVQYLPVILQALQSYFSIPSDHIVSNRINVAATPWSDWSTPTDFAVLPANENILPWMKSSQTINPRPTFGWGANALNAQYEFWVENRVTKQRVIHRMLTNVREFTPTTDLPAGQYDWWVRIVGTEGARKGWSPKQSLEIFAPAISTNVVAETVDATPIVSWTPMSNAQSYIIRITSTATGRVVYQATETSNRSSHRVAETLLNDTYTVSIQATLPNGGLTAPGRTNAASGFQVPTMIVGAPPKNVILTSSKVSWDAVNGATRYQVWMTVTNSGGTTRIFNTNAYTTELAIAGDLDSHARPGTNEFRVWVRAIRDEAGHESTGRWSMLSRYSLTLNASLARQVAATDDSNVLSMVMSELATSSLLDAVA